MTLRADDFHCDHLGCRAFAEPDDPRGSWYAAGGYHLCPRHTDDCQACGDPVPFHSDEGVAMCLRCCERSNPEVTAMRERLARLEDFIGGAA